MQQPAPTEKALLARAGVPQRAPTWRLYWRRLKAHPLALVGTLVFCFFLLMAFIGPWVAPYEFQAQEIASRLQPPGAQHLFGTDQYGRDLLSRVMSGGVNSMIVGLATVAIGLLTGVLLGMLAAYRRGIVDEVIMRLSDLLFAFPAVLTAILVTSVTGPSMANATLAIAIFYIPVFARLTRAMALSVWEREFIVAARASGTGELDIAWRHVMPNILPALIIQATIQFAVAILAEAGLSYLGLGIQPPHASWGRMLNEAQTLMGMAPWIAVFPGLAISGSVLGFSLLGDGLRDALDPRLSSGR